MTRFCLFRIIGGLFQALKYLARGGSATDRPCRTEDIKRLRLLSSVRRGRSARSALSPVLQCGGDFRLIVLLIAALLPWTSPVQAQQAATPPLRPQVLVVLTDHLTLSDFENVRLEYLHNFLEVGESALMSPGLAKGTDPVSNVYASLGAGDSIRQGEILQGSLAATLRDAKISVTTIGDASGDDTGVFQPMSLFLPGAPHVNAGVVADPVAPGGLDRKSVV